MSLRLLLTVVGTEAFLNLWLGSRNMMSVAEVIKVFVIVMHRTLPTGHDLDQRDPLLREEAVDREAHD
jgi:hypothetical protein